MVENRMAGIEAIRSADPEAVKAGREETIRKRMLLKSVTNVRKPVRRRRRLPDEVPTMRAAIVGMCAECIGHGDDKGMGTISQQIRDCTATECWLHFWRNGKPDWDLVEKLAAK